MNNLAIKKRPVSLYLSVCLSINLSPDSELTRLSSSDGMCGVEVKCATSNHQRPLNKRERRAGPKIGARLRDLDANASLLESDAED